MTPSKVRLIRITEWII